jgi:hypothetical protein
VADVQVVAGGWHVSEQALHAEQRVAVPGRLVEIEVGLGRVEHHDAALVALEEDRVLITDDLGDAERIVGTKAEVGDRS